MKVTLQEVVGRWPSRVSVNKGKGAYLVSDVYFFLNRLRELGCFGRARPVEVLAFPGSCMPNMAGSD